MRDSGIPWRLSCAALAYSVFITTVLLGCVSGNLSSPRIASAEPASPSTQSLPGKLLFVSKGNLWVWEKGSAHQLTSGGSWSQPDWSPDGERMAFVLLSESYSEIFTMRPDGQEMAQLTRSRRGASSFDWVFRPRWSPDGGRLAYLADTTSFYPSVWLMNPDGSGKRQLVRPLHGRDAYDGISWAPDGSALAVTSFRTGVGQVYRVNMDQPGRVAPLTRFEGGAFDPAWAADGRHLAIAAREGGRSEIYVISSDSEETWRISDASPARSPAWSPEGSYIAYVSASNGEFELLATPIEIKESGVTAPGTPMRLAPGVPVDAVSGLSWAR